MTSVEEIMPSMGDTNNTSSSGVRGKSDPT